MVKSKSLRNSEPSNQSMSEVHRLLAQAKAIQESTASKQSTSCLDCVRSADLKYCYDAETGAGKCCSMNDLESKGCNREENPRIVCSTDKLIAASAPYEVCPHNQDQCDTKMLFLNNRMQGHSLDDHSKDSTKELLNTLEEGGAGIFGTSPMLEGLTTRKTSQNATYQENKGIVASGNGEAVTESGEISEVKVRSLAEVSESKALNIDNQVAQVPLIDDSYWRQVEINSQNGTVCSYQLLNQDGTNTNNVFEIQLSGLANVQIGLYYGQFGEEDMDALQSLTSFFYDMSF